MARKVCACLGDVADKLCGGKEPSLPPPRWAQPTQAQVTDREQAVATSPQAPALATPQSRQSRQSRESRESQEAPAAVKRRARSPRGHLPPPALREDPASQAFFCGRWPGRRNDYEGEAGFRFEVERDCEVTALGRPAEPPLMEVALVSLWHAKTQERLVSTMVGPASRVDGFYAWEPLMEPVRLRPGEEYRLSQRCRANMLDRWSDDQATEEELAGKSWASLARFLGGVCRNGPGFPNRLDGALRRPGIVNFKALLRPAWDPMLREVDREEFAKCLALAVAERGQGIEEIELRLAALAGLLALLVDELSGVGAMALLAPEEELEMIADSAAACSRTGELELAGASVFDCKVLCQEMYFAARRGGLLDAGLLLVSFSGEVLGLVPRPRASAEAPSFDSGRPLQAWELAEKLRSGLAFAKHSAEIVAYDAKQLQTGGFRLHTRASAEL